MIAVTAPGCQEGIGRALRDAYRETLNELPRELEEYLARLH